MSNRRGFSQVTYSFERGGVGVETPPVDAGGAGVVGAVAGGVVGEGDGGGDWERPVNASSDAIPVMNAMVRF